MSYTPVPTKNEDAVHADGDSGIPMFGMRRDADTSPVSNDGDYHLPVFNSLGRLKVSTMPGDYVPTTGNITTNTGTVAADVSRASNVMVQITGTFTGLNATFEISLDGGTTYVGTQVVRTNSNTIETTTGVTNGITAYGWEASVNACTHFRVRATAFTTGTAVIRILPGSYATEPVPAMQTHAVTISSGTSSVNGTVAHDGVDTGGPVKIGSKAYSTNPAKVASLDRADTISDLQGKMVVVGSIRDLKVPQTTTITNTTETTILTAGAAGVFHDVYGLFLTNSSATAVTVAIKDATAGTTRMTLAVPAGATVGFTLNESAAHNQAVAANNWTATASAAVTSLFVTVLAVKNL